MIYDPEEFFSKKIVSRDPIIRRRQINQHNINSYLLGAPSHLCFGLTHCYDKPRLDKRELSCNRCHHRDDMDKFPDRAFIGYTLQ